MLPTIIHTLEPLASSHAVHLVVGLYVSGALLLLSPDDRLLLPFFLLHRGIVMVLLWSNIGSALVAASSAASLAVGLIYLVTMYCLYRRAAVAIARTTRGALPLTYLPFRALAVALALLLTYGLLQRYAPPALPPLVSWSVTWLLVEFCFAVLLAPSTLHSGLGILAFADAARILYALLRPDPLVWGLWASCDVLVALAAAHLRTVEVAAYGGVDLQRTARPGRQSIRDTLKSRLAPALERGMAPPEGAVSTAEAEQAPPDDSAFTASETAPPGESEPEPETGETP